MAIPPAPNKFVWEDGDIRVSFVNPIPERLSAVASAAPKDDAGLAAYLTDEVEKGRIPSSDGMYLFIVLSRQGSGSRG